MLLDAGQRRTVGAARPSAALSLHNQRFRDNRAAAKKLFRTREAEEQVRSHVRRYDAGRAGGQRLHSTRDAPRARVAVQAPAATQRVLLPLRRSRCAGPPSRRTRPGATARLVLTAPVDIERRLWRAGPPRLRSCRRTCSLHASVHPARPGCVPCSAARSHRARSGCRRCALRCEHSLLTRSKQPHSSEHGTWQSLPSWTFKRAQAIHAGALGRHTGSGCAPRVGLVTNSPAFPQHSSKATSVPQLADRRRANALTGQLAFSSLGSRAANPQS